MESVKKGKKKNQNPLAQERSRVRKDSKETTESSMRLVKEV